MTDVSTTKIEAVNQVLSGVGQSPVNSIGDDAPKIAKQAELVLDERSKAGQSEGWWFNTEAGLNKVTLEPDAGGIIAVPPEIARLSVRRERFEVVRRGNRLYNRKDKTFVFTEGVEVWASYLLPWDDLPESFRAFVVAQSIRVLGDRLFGDPQRNAQALRDERYARATLEAEERENEGWVIFTDGRSGQGIADRASPLDRLDTRS